MGKTEEYISNNILSSLSLYVRDSSVKYLWYLETLNNSDPIKSIQIKIEWFSNTLVLIVNYQYIPMACIN